MRSFCAVLALALPASQDEGARKAREWVEKLGSDTLEERDEATRKLKELGRRAIPELEKAARSTDAEIASRASAILRAIPVLEKLPARFVQDMPGIEDRLASGEPRAWTEAFLALAEEREGKPRYPNLRAEDFEPLAGPAVRGARRDSDRQEELRRVLLVVEQWSLRSAASEVAKLLRDSAVCSPAADTLKNLDAVEVVPDLIPLLGDPQQPVRFTVADVLGELGGRQAVPGLRGLLQDPDGGVRERAVEALGRLGAKEAVSDLIPLLRAGEANRRGAVAGALGRLGAAEAIPVLVEALEKGSGRVRTSAMDALAALGAREAVPRLVRALSDEDANVRSAAARILGRLGAKEAAAEIARLLDDAQSNVRGGALDALATLGAREHLRAMAGRLDDPEASVRSSAARAVARLGAKEEIPRLERLLEDPGASVRGQAAEALAALGARDMIPKLLKLLESDDWITRSYALRALADLEAREAAPAVARLLEKGESHVRSTAVWVLARLGGKDRIGEIRKLLTDPRFQVRMQAAESLCHLGSTDGVPLILREARDRRWPVREAGSALYIGKSPFALNALRSPQVWERLVRTPLPETLEGTRKSLVERLAREARLEVEWSEAVKWEEDPWIQGRTRLTIYSKRQTFVGQLSLLLRGRFITNKISRYDVIVEPGKLRVMRYHDALKAWESWWEGVQKERSK